MNKNKSLYIVIISDDAQRGIDKSPAKLRNRLLKIIKSLSDDPYPSRYKPLQGYENYFRIPLENWRIIYAVEEDIITVTVIRVTRKTGPETYYDLET